MKLVHIKCIDFHPIFLLLTSAFKHSFRYQNILLLSYINIFFQGANNILLVNHLYIQVQYL